MKPTFTTRGSNGGSGPSTSRAATPMNARFLRPTPRTRQSADGPNPDVQWFSFPKLTTHARRAAITVEFVPQRVISS